MGDGEQTVDSIPKSFEPLKGLIDGGAVLGYGTSSGGRMLEEQSNYGNDKAKYIEYTDSIDGRRRTALSVIDEVALNKIAREMGVNYVHRTQPDDASQLVQTVSIDKIATDAYDRNSFVELYWILAIGLVALSIWEFLSLLNEIALARYKPKGVS
jgi:Ca-activated chloride channel family protein